MRESRTKNVAKNSYVGILCQLLIALFAFITRTVFIKTLGVEYLGVNGLYSNILSMLALSDLGVYTVMVYSLYKPIASDDREKVANLIRYFQKLYWGIALVVLAVGLCLIPVLPKLVKGSMLAKNELVKYYVLYLLNSLISYIAISKSTLLRASQRIDIIQLVTTATTVAMNLLQIVFLIATRNFTVYLYIQIILSLASNMILSIIADKKYPYIKASNRLTVDKTIKQELTSNLKATFLYKVGNMIMNSTDNILISTILGTGIVGLYSNYVTVFTLVNKFIMILINALLPSVGNYMASEESDKKNRLFRCIQMAFYALATFCCSCYLCGMEDFIRIWIGDAFVIEGGFIFALAFNRFIYCIVHPLWIIRESSGVFVSTRYVMLFAALINIALSVILGRSIGISGIIIATGLSYLLTIFWYEPRQLTKLVFHCKQSSYWSYTIKLLLCAVPSFILATMLRTNTRCSIFVLLIKFILCFVMTMVTYWLVFRKKDEFKWFVSKVKSLSNRRSGGN